MCVHVCACACVRGRGVVGAPIGTVRLVLCDQLAATSEYNEHYMHATPRIALHCIALHCIALHCIALHCIALHCIALHCIALMLALTPSLSESSMKRRGNVKMQTKSVQSSWKLQCLHLHFCLSCRKATRTSTSQQKA